MFYIGKLLLFEEYDKSFFYIFKYGIILLVIGNNLIFKYEYYNIYFYIILFLFLYMLWILILLKFYIF